MRFVAVILYGMSRASNQLGYHRALARGMGVMTRSCYDERKDLKIPDSCKAFMGPNTSISQTNPLLEFCRRESYMNYLAIHPRLFAKKLAIKDAGECGRFWMSYDAIAYQLSLASPKLKLSYKSNQLVRSKVAIVVLDLIQHLHELGFGHGAISLSAFGSDVFEPLIDNRKSLVHGSQVKLGNLLQVKSVFNDAGDSDFEGLMTVKKDLMDFTEKVIKYLFPETRLYRELLRTVEVIKVDDFNFDYREWKRLLEQVGQVQFVDSIFLDEEVGSDPGVVAPELDLYLISHLLEEKQACRARGRLDFGQCPATINIDGISGPLEKTTKGIYKGSDLSVEEFTDRTCSEEAILKVYGGLGDHLPRLFTNVHPGCAFFVEVFSRPVKLNVLLNTANLSILYLALEDAIKAVKLLHDRGIVHNELHDPESIQILSNHKTKLIRLRKASLYVQPAGRRHATRLETSFTRKTDMKSLALIAAKALGFKNGVLNRFYSAMDSLGWSQAPDYGYWQHHFHLEAQMAVPRRTGITPSLKWHSDAPAWRASPVGISQVPGSSDSLTSDVAESNP